MILNVISAVTVCVCVCVCVWVGGQPEAFTAFGDMRDLIIIRVNGIYLSKTKGRILKLAFLEFIFSKDTGAVLAVR